MRKDDVIKLFEEAFVTKMNHLVNATEVHLDREKLELLIQRIDPYLESLSQNIKNLNSAQLESLLMIFEHSLTQTDRSSFYYERLSEYMMHLSAQCKQLMVEVVISSEDSINHTLIINWMKRALTKKEFSSPDSFRPIIDLFSDLEKIDQFRQSFQNYAGKPSASGNRIFAILKLLHYSISGDNKSLSNLLNVQSENNELIKRYIKIITHQGKTEEAREITRNKFEETYVKVSAKKSEYEAARSKLVWDEINGETDVILEEAFFLTQYLEWYAVTLISIYLKANQLDETVQLVLRINTDRDTFNRQFRINCYKRIAGHLNEEQRMFFLDKIFEADRFIILDIEEMCLTDGNWHNLIRACNKRLTKLSDINCSVQRYGTHMVKYTDPFFTMYRDAILTYTEAGSGKDRKRKIQAGLEQTLVLDKSRKYLFELIAKLQKEFSSRYTLQEMIRNFYEENDMKGEYRSYLTSKNIDLDLSEESIADSKKSTVWEDPARAAAKIDELEKKNDIHAFSRSWSQALPLLNNELETRFLTGYARAAILYATTSTDPEAVIIRNVNRFFNRTEKKFQAYAFILSVLDKMKKKQPQKKIYTEYLSNYRKHIKFMQRQ